MRRISIGIILICMVLLWPKMGSGHHSPASTPQAATPRAATPVAELDSDALATRVADLESTVAAQQVAQITLGLGIDEVQQSLAVLLDGAPEQAVTIAFLQSQIDDLRVRVDELERQLTATPAQSGGHPLVGQWVVTDVSSGGDSGRITFTAEGTVVVLSPAGSTAVGVWEATGPQSAIAVWVFPEPVGPQVNPGGLQVQIRLDSSGQVITMSYRVIDVTARGAATEQADGVVTGRRIPDAVPTPESRLPSESRPGATPTRT